MLKKLTLKYFRQHEDRTFDFTTGLNVVRGANEGGKTTLLEAIGYALGGVKACRDSLADIVTYGHAERDLKVELELRFDGVDYFVKRSKSGAEVNYDGGRVVGQSEVTGFFERLFGCDMATLAKLMMASQGSIRGALDAGPKATMELIETLSDFGIVDWVLELITTHLTTGPTASVEERIQAAQAAYSAAAGACVVPDTTSLEGAVTTYAATVRVKQGEIDSTLKPAFLKAEAAYHAADRAQARRQQLEASLRAAVAAKGQREAQLAEAKAAAEGGPDAFVVETARTALQVAQNVEAEMAIFRAYQKLGLPEVHWEGSQASFEAEVKRLENLRQTAVQLLGAAQKDQAQALAEIRVLQATRVTGSACGFCDKDVSAIPEVVAKNAAIDQAIKAQQGALAIAEVAVKENQRVALEAATELQDLTAVANSARPCLAFIERYGDRVDVSDATFPPSLLWTGPIPNEVNPKVLQDEVARLDLAAKQAAMAAGRVQALERGLKEDEHQIETLRGQIAECGEAHALAERKADLDAAQAAYSEASGAVSEAKYLKEQAEAEIRALRAAYEAGKRGVDAAQASLDRAIQDLDTLNFNNALLKKVRAARPLIADKLWTLVLSTVSTYFSAMRGTKSVVTREGNVFKVDGHVVGGGSLSGSALDCLGLALRVALTKTFLPNSPLLTLDEPAAAMDRDRTAATIGFLQGCGFEQTLLVTHEEDSESVADNLITL